MRILHIVDGDTTSGSLRLSGLAKGRDILVWRDALYSGPAPDKLSLPQLSRLRSRYWTDGKSESQFDKRDSRMTKHAGYDEIVLWFGPGCASCNLALAQIFSWFLEEGTSQDRLWWVAVHGGMLRPDQMATALDGRRSVSAAQLKLSSRVWDGFRQPSPRGLLRLLEEDLEIVQGLRHSLLWLLQEYPDTRSGLSRLERELLQEIRRLGEAKASRAVGWVLTRDWVGDTLLFDMLRNFVKAEHPLLEFAQPFSGKVESWKFNGALALTRVGKRVLEGKVDAIALNGIDRWLGGIHLRGRKIRWRWDRKRRTLVSIRP